MRFIPDREINNLDEKNDLLGTKVYVDTLVEIIQTKQDDEPLTIGLLGGWGTGKSSIVKTVAKQLKTHDKIKVMCYNAWKYSQDAFRRSFILELITELDLPIKNKLHSILYEDTTEETDHKIEVKNFWWMNFIIILPLLLLLILLTPQSNELKTLISLLGVFLSGLTYLVKESFVQYKISVKKSKLFSPEQFEKVFMDAITGLTSHRKFSTEWFKQILTGSKKIEKIVIIIDNIDRCHKELAKELLLTVKNFLEHEKCVLIIPIDDEAIKKNLEFEGNEGEEFLRKFFNITLRIKKFSPRDLYEFTNQLNQKYKLDFSPKISSIVSQEFSKNPRRIIQFLNNLYSEKIVAEFQEKNGLIKKGCITNNLEFLAKILIIKEEWPELYEKMNLNTNLDIEILKNIKDDNYKIDDEGVNYMAKDFTNLVLSPEQYRFFKSTQTIDTNNIEPFLRLQDFYRNFPDELIPYMKSQDWDNIKKLLSENTIQFQQFWGLLCKNLDESINHRQLMDLEGFNLISLVFLMISDRDYAKYFDNIYHDIEQFLNHAEIIRIIDKFNPEILLNYTKKLTSKRKFYLRDFIATNINNGKKPNEKLMNEYIKSFSNDGETLSKIKKTFSKMLSDNFTNISKFKEILEQGNNAKFLINDVVIDDTIVKIKQGGDDDKENPARVEFLKTLNEVNALSAEKVNYYLNQVIDFLDTQDYEIIDFWLSGISGFINSNDENNKKKINADNKEKVYAKLQKLYNFLFQHYYAQGQRGEIQTKCNLKLLSSLKEYYLAIKEVNSPAIDHISNYFNKNESPQLCLAANEQFQRIIENYGPYEWPFSNTILNRFNSISDFNHRKEIASSIILMLEKTIYENTEYSGLSEDQIKQATEQFFDVLFTGNDEESVAAERWIFKISKFKLVRPFIESKMSSLSDIDEQIRALKIADDLKDKKLITTIVKGLVNRSTDYDDLSNNIKLTEENIGESDKYIKSALIEFLEEVTTENFDLYQDTINVVIEKQKIFSKNDLGKVIEKLRPSLASDQYERQVFALTKLNELNVIPQSKHPLLRTLIENISFRKKSDNNLLESVKRKLKP